MERTTIQFEKIILSSENPRLDVSFSEAEAIQKMIDDQKGKLAELASDIVTHGLNPLELIAVVPSYDYPGYFEVAEGNRRICALKILADPSLIEHMNPSLYMRFKALSEKIIVPTEVEVALFDQLTDAQHWMEIRHMGEQGGKGLSKWDSVQKMRFQKIQHGTDALLDFWNWMDSHSILSMDDIMSVTKTNWQRILRDPYFPFLKIQYNGQYVVQDDDVPTFTERIRAVQKKLAGQTVGIVYDQIRISEFYDQLSLELYGVHYEEVANPNVPQTEQIYLELFNDLDDSFQESGVVQSPPSECGLFESVEDHKAYPTPMAIDGTTFESRGVDPIVAATSSRDPFNGCATVIPRSYGIRSSNMRLNKIINELKRLNPDEYPNACGALLRTLFELSSKVFLEAQVGTDMTEKDFQQAIKGAADKLRTMGRITNGEHSSITKDVNSLRMLFNGYMHNTDGYPSSLALKNLFKAHLRFIEECLK